MSDQKHDHDHDHDHGFADDNGGSAHPGDKTAVPALKSSTAVTSLAELQAMFATLNTSSLVVGTYGRPLLLFSNEDGGTYTLGRKKLKPEANSRWAFNPSTFGWGWVYFDARNKPISVMAPVSRPKPERPDMIHPWLEQRSVNVRCIDGVDAGSEATFKVNTVGGVQAVDAMIITVHERLLGNLNEGKITPVGLLEKDSYVHPEFKKKIWNPVLTIVDWMPPEGPAPAPAPEPSSPSKAPQATAAEQPRRRRVVG
jgi:hypothetical protein